MPTNVRGDEQRLRQVLFNLLSNAVKFTDKGGVVFKVGVVATDLADETDSSAKSVARIRFQVEDSGIGIASEHLEEIFLPFQQVGDRRQMREGTGLGLAISRKLVEMMSGNLEVRSAPGQGSIFEFELEMLEVEGWHPKTTIYPDKVPEVIGYKGQRRKVLVVDEQRENRTVLVKFLAPLGFEIVEAENGQQGLVKAAEFEPDVIFMDLVMPVMDGFEATRQLRRSPDFQNTVIIAASASAFEHDQQTSLNVGCNAFLSKPIRYKQLLATLEQLLGFEMGVGGAGK
ncbi:MAG: response regulator [Leptolyngbyaceae cyanobacterium RU_5_1]|nr:response regulator [Leptolyngbyaceae cyanobacterium RU_5_1]